MVGPHATVPEKTVHHGRDRAGLLRKGHLHRVHGHSIVVRVPGTLPGRRPGPLQQQASRQPGTADGVPFSTDLPHVSATVGPGTLKDPRKVPLCDRHHSHQKQGHFHCHARTLQTWQLESATGHQQWGGADPGAHFSAGVVGPVPPDHDAIEEGRKDPVAPAIAPVTVCNQLLRRDARGPSLRIDFGAGHVRQGWTRRSNRGDEASHSREFRPYVQDTPSAAVHRGWAHLPHAQDTLVFLNGTFFAVTRKPEALESAIVSMRRSQNIAFETRVAWNRKTYMRRYFFINTDCSAAIRPVYVVENLHRLHAVVKTTGTSPMLWQRLVQAGVIEYIDKEEEDARHLLIATFAKDLRHTAKPYTHIEIDPTNILGLMGNLIPFSDHNQSPRNMYWTSQGRQALSVASLANRRSGLHQYVLNYPQKPLVATRLDRHVTKSVGGITMGNEVTYAIMCFDGRNMEDSIYLKKSALERGLFRTTYYKQFVTEARTKGGEGDHRNSGRALPAPKGARQLQQTGARRHRARRDLRRAGRCPDRKSGPRPGRV